MRKLKKRTVSYAELHWWLPAVDYSLAMVAMADCHSTMDKNHLHKKLGHTSKALMQKMQNLWLEAQKSI